MKRLICLALVSASCIATGCVSPITEALKWLDTPAGQKLVDKMEMTTEADNPAIEVYAITGFGIRALGVRTKGSVSGAVSDDERGFAPTTNRPVEVP